jgi:hypothetical protein
MYAMISASGKKSRLSRKYPMKLWPLRAATLAGQKAIAIQMTTPMIHHNHMMFSASQEVDVHFDPVIMQTGLAKVVTQKA